MLSLSPCGLTGAFDPGTAEFAGRATFPFGVALCSVFVEENAVFEIVLWLIDSTLT